MLIFLLLTKLLENNPVDIPQEMVDTQINNKVAQLEAQAKQYGLETEMLLQYFGFENMDDFKIFASFLANKFFPNIETLYQYEKNDK